MSDDLPFAVTHLRLRAHAPHELRSDRDYVGWEVTISPARTPALREPDARVVEHLNRQAIAPLRGSGTDATSSRSSKAFNQRITRASGRSVAARHRMKSPAAMAARSVSTWSVTLLLSRSPDETSVITAASASSR